MSKVSMGTVPQGWQIVARVQAATLNIILTILYQKAEWSKESLEQYEEEYTIMLRRYRDKGKIGKQIRASVGSLKEQMDVHLNVNKDIPDTRANRLIETTWRECLMCGLLVLRQCNDTKALWSVLEDFSDFMDALTDAHHGRFNEAVFINMIRSAEEEEALDRQRASIELLNDTMHFLGKGQS